MTPTRSAAIGVDVGGTTTKAGIVSASGELITRTERPTDPSAGTKGIIAVLEDLLARSGDVSISAVGVGAAGFVGEESVVFSPNLTYDDPHIVQALRSRFDLPAVVDNDANAAAWGEFRFGAARGAMDLVLLNLGTGVGSGIIVDGALLRGHSGTAGELGHTVVDPDGPLCPCGLRGCVEQFVSGGAISRAARAAIESDPDSTLLAFAGTPEEITAEHVGRAAREYDESSRSVLRTAGTMLGIALSNVANVFDPEVIVLAGGVTAIGEPLLGPARDELVRSMSAQRRRPMRLDVSTLGTDVGILGAAALALDKTRS
ncbi:MAG TPA: ROK family protein [Actinomycetota bacterium]|nr:ROK family protein [Actinomycetota bacterium]